MEVLKVVFFFFFFGISSKESNFFVAVAEEALTVIETRPNLRGNADFVGSGNENSKHLSDVSHDTEKKGEAAKKSENFKKKAKKQKKGGKATHEKEEDNTGSSGSAVLRPDHIPPLISDVSPFDRQSAETTNIEKSENHLEKHDNVIRETIPGTTIVKDTALTDVPEFPSGILPDLSRISESPHFEDKDQSCECTDCRKKEMKQINKQILEKRNEKEAKRRVEKKPSYHQENIEKPPIKSTEKKELEANKNSQTTKDVPKEVHPVQLVMKTTAEKEEKESISPVKAETPSIPTSISEEASSTFPQAQALSPLRKIDRNIQNNNDILMNQTEKNDVESFPKLESPKIEKSIAVKRQGGPDPTSTTTSAGYSYHAYFLTSFVCIIPLMFSML